MIDRMEIATASRVRLTCITYRYLIDELNALRGDNPSGVHKALALQAVKTLAAGLDTFTPLGQELLTLYMFIQRTIILGNQEEIEKCIDITNNLLSAYETIEKEELKTKTMTTPGYGEYGLDEQLIGICTSVQV